MLIAWKIISSKKKIQSPLTNFNNGTISVDFEISSSGSQECHFCIHVAEKKMPSPREADTINIKTKIGRYIALL